MSYKLLLRAHSGKTGPKAPRGKHYVLVLFPANCQRRMEWLLISNLHLCNGPGLLVLSASLIRKTPLKTSKKGSHGSSIIFFQACLWAENVWHSTGNTGWFHGKILSSEQRMLNYSSTFYSVYLLKCVL